ncbi:MAG: hypothetical protein ACQEXJ_08150 [Myxococcota bacterium]
MSTSALRLGVLVAALAALAWHAPPGARAASSPECARAAETLRSGRTLNPVREARRLRRLHRRDPACVEAPEAAFALLEKVRDRMIPVATGPASKDTVRKEWTDFRRNARFVQAIAAFEEAPSRPRAALALARMDEAMATYLDQVGTGPDRVVVVKETPEALYHTRAVDLSEHLKLRAERGYRSVLDMYPDARMRNAVIREARQRLHDLESRRLERREEAESRPERAAGGEGDAGSEREEETGTGATPED